MYVTTNITWPPREYVAPIKDIISWVIFNRARPVYDANPTMPWNPVMGETKDHCIWSLIKPLYTHRFQHQCDSDRRSL